MLKTDKSILVFYPHNFYELSAGTHRRIYDLLTYFRDRGFSVDILSMNGFTNTWSEEELKRNDLFDSIRVCRWNPLQGKIMKAWSLVRTKSVSLSVFVARQLKNTIREMTAKKQYDFVIISYVYWADLADEIGPGSVKVIDLHDFITLQTFMLSKNKKKFRLGRMFEEEVKAISKFDVALSISEEETLMLAPFCPETCFVNAPVAFPIRFKSTERTEFDILFVGSDNPFNKAGIEWFMEKVYPLLPNEFRIAIVGKASKYVKKKPNITLISHIEDLEKVYTKARLTFCPLKGGTGLKIKVVESLSYGIPVVTTSWGLSGILDKIDNGCIVEDTPEKFARSIKLLLKDEAEYMRVKKQAECFFRSHFAREAWENMLDGFFLNN